MRIGELLKASAVPLNENGGVLHRRQDQYPVATFDRVLSGRYQVGEQFENRHLALTFSPVQRDRAEWRLLKPAARGRRLRAVGLRPSVHLEMPRATLRPHSEARRAPSTPCA